MGDCRKSHDRSQFTEEEDCRLLQLVSLYGTKKWKVVSAEMPGRNPRQCRDRYNKYLSPDISPAPWSKEEDEVILSKYQLFGNQWCKIAEYLPGRTNINIYNRYKYLLKSGAADQKVIRKEALDSLGTWDVAAIDYEAFLASILEAADRSNVGVGGICKQF